MLTKNAKQNNFNDILSFPQKVTMIIYIFSTSMEKHISENIPRDFHSNRWNIFPPTFSLNFLWTHIFSWQKITLGIEIKYHSGNIRFFFQTL